MGKQSYKNRLAVCKQKIRTDPKRAELWRMAVEVYEHLLKCNKKHTVYYGQIECQSLG